MQIADTAPLQLYSSALVFTPKNSIIRKTFYAEVPSEIPHWSMSEESWGAESQTLRGHSDRVQSVAVSPDGRLLASGSYDNTIKLWDLNTGKLRQTLEGHSNLIQSVAFSPDGRLLASGSRDKTIKLWDPTTGELWQTLEGH
jgi:WD40 repeat protein